MCSRVWFTFTSEQLRWSGTVFKDHGDKVDILVDLWKPTITERQKYCLLLGILKAHTKPLTMEYITHVNVYDQRNTIFMNIRPRQQSRQHLYVGVYSPLQVSEPLRSAVNQLLSKVLYGNPISSLPVIVEDVSEEEDSKTSTSDATDVPSYDTTQLPETTLVSQARSGHKRKRGQERNEAKSKIPKTYACSTPSQVQTLSINGQAQASVLESKFVVMEHNQIHAQAMTNSILLQLFQRMSQLTNTIEQIKQELNRVESVTAASTINMEEQIKELRQTMHDFFIRTSSL